MKILTTTITLQKTVQVQQFHPVVVSISETIELSENDDVVKIRNESYRKMTKQVDLYINHHLKD